MSLMRSRIADRLNELDEKYTIYIKSLMYRPDEFNRLFVSITL